MKKNIVIFIAMVAMVVTSGCAYRIGNVQGVINPFLVPVGGYGYYQNTPVCRPWCDRIICEQITVPRQIYYNNAPFNPGYTWNYWYTIPAQPGFVFFFGNDGRHYRHQYNGPQQHRQQKPPMQRRSR